MKMIETEDFSVAQRNETINKKLYNNIIMFMILSSVTEIIVVQV